MTTRQFGTGAHSFIGYDTDAHGEGAAGTVTHGHPSPATTFSGMGFAHD